MTGRVVLVHGIRSNGVRNIHRLDPHLRGLGYEVVRADLPIRRAIMVRWRWQHDAELLTGIVADGDVVVGHSYGGALAYLVAQRRALRAAYLFNPALDRDVDLSRMVGSPPTWCIHSRGDDVVWWSGLIPGHIFGRAGHSGLLDLPAERNVEIGGGHSDAFVGRGAERWADFIHTTLQEAAAS